MIAVVIVPLWLAVTWWIFCFLLDVTADARYDRRIRKIERQKYRREQQMRRLKQKELGAWTSSDYGMVALLIVTAGAGIVHLVRAINW